MTTAPTRVDGDLFDAAKSSGALNSRSAAQQINHWARIGRELEASGNLSQRDIERVLAGQAAYDSLGEREQAVVRVSWREQVAERVGELDLEREFTAADESWSEWSNGDVTVHEPRDR